MDTNEIALWKGSKRTRLWEAVQSKAYGNEMLLRRIKGFTEEEDIGLESDYEIGTATDGRRSCVLEEMKLYAALLPLEIRQKIMMHLVVYEWHSRAFRRAAGIACSYRRLLHWMSSVFGLPVGGPIYRSLVAVEMAHIRTMAYAMRALWDEAVTTRVEENDGTSDEEDMTNVFTHGVRRSDPRMVPLFRLSFEESEAEEHIDCLCEGEERTHLTIKHVETFCTRFWYDGKVYTPYRAGENAGDILFFRKRRETADTVVCLNQPLGPCLIVEAARRYLFDMNKLAHMFKLVFGVTLFRIVDKSEEGWKDVFQPVIVKMGNI